uniref:Uncharacterized protein n=1 Tax=Steinernema glaseri TaxID=37863 RepID=A0A1I7Y0Y7_9BILA
MRNKEHPEGPEIIGTFTRLSRSSYQLIFNESTLEVPAKTLLLRTTSFIMRKTTSFIMHVLTFLTSGTASFLKEDTYLRHKFELF